MNVNIKPIFGNWDLGYALDKHSASSTFTGHNEYGHPTYDTIRTEIGESLYQLKYKGDWSNVNPIAQQIYISLFPLFRRAREDKISMIIPMPASSDRPRQPVYEIGRALSIIAGIPIFENIIMKNSTPLNTPSLKNLGSREEKDAVLKGRFYLNNQIKNNGKWNALLLDDLYHTGATMNAACTVLRTYNKINKVFAACVTWR